jgi:hypothetical protein
MLAAQEATSCPVDYRQIGAVQRVLARYICCSNGG